ncbi:MAG: sulfur oxidation c-type cytochrome SoxX [Sulfurimicrobium sp.]|nr:sulfur oxidation c-type cytochrome SoxX [Sulfurimicrobium sp.]MDO9190482.1 sulfur oxidation c-type cytochrome SoxX [Sulfurimicrobium sp.]MDP1705013.1 sulfur oxidation c-type cytochrome SoxX [Sulfurimicrobium sp.]MDP1898479.1 sulfur oxidation c-type cytochrome SoxX [Sulfurimicrobium sp.]MDP2199349.1 sulfur oxidation c-type cytochrome SoxX [Sulfurimicrobium sp.]
MRQRISLLMAALVLGAGVSGPVWAAEEKAEAKKEMPGQEIAFSNKKGNCLACHAMPGTKGEMAGSIAPPLIAMKLRFPDRAKLRAQVWDATVANPKTSMPPIGKHEILTEEEIDQVVDFIYTL